MAECLLNFKQKYPDQVTLLAGNRDLNKLRLWDELDATYLLLPPDDPDIFFPYWQPKKYVTTLSEHLQQISSAASERKTHATLDFVPQSWRQNSDDIRVDTPVERLRWILKHTMGAAGGFEYRRRELAVMRGCSSLVTSVSNEDVLNSYRDSVGPGGILRDYLRETDIMKIIGDTLFVHGAVTAENVGRMPDAAGGTHKDAAAWASSLNNWKHERVEAWCEGGGCAQLVDYAVPGGAQGRTVVYNSWLDADHRPQHNKDPGVAAFLNRSGIRRVVSQVCVGLGSVRVGAIG